MNTAKESNIKSIAVISLVSILLFGIFYYLITDVSNSSSSIKAQDNKTREQSAAQTYVADAEKPAEAVAQAEPADAQPEGDVKGESTEQNAIPAVDQTAKEAEPEPEKESVFKTLSAQKATAQPGVVLGGADQQTTQSTVPTTGSETIFAAFVVSSLVMFTGIYLLLTQPKNAALAKFEKRIIREMD